jgi:putative membrane protein
MVRRPLRLTALVAVLAAAGLIAPAGAQKPAAEPAKPAASRADQAPGREAIGAQERKFITDAAMGGMHEVEAGQLAARKATSAEVKSFAQRMVTDHGKANEGLKRVAAAKGVLLPTGLDRKHRNELERLEKLSGANFDREYMKHMVDDHKKDVAEFRRAANDLKDPEVRNFASSKLPTLEEHVKLAEKAADGAKSADAKR